MAANNIPLFVATPRVAGCVIATANANYDGTGTIGTVITAGANGSRVDRVKIKCRAASAAALVRFFVYDGVSAYRFIHEEAVTAVGAPSATVSTFEQDVDLNLFLPSGYSLVVATSVSQSTDVTATIAGDF